MSRRQTQQQRDRRGQPSSAPRAAVQPSGDGSSGGFRGWLRPRYVIPVLAAAVVALGALSVVLGLTRDEGGDTFQVNIAGCDPQKDANCKARGPTHEHADFALYINGQPFDFNQPAFVSHEDDEKSPIVHIHPERYTVVHVHETGTTWDEFFRSLKMDLKDPTVLGTTPENTSLKMADGTVYKTEAGKSFHFYVNGVKVDGVSFTEIHDLDRVLIAYGSETDDQAKALFANVTDVACIVSERCKDRIPPNEPKEECQGGVGTGCVKPGG